MLWFSALISALMVGGSLGKSIIQGSDVTGLRQTPPGSFDMTFLISGHLEEQVHRTGEIEMNHDGDPRHAEVDHTATEEKDGSKDNIRESFVANSKTPDDPAKSVVEARKGNSEEKGWVFQMFPKSHRNWFGAKHECEAWGGHLAIPDTKEKIRELTQILHAYIEEIGETTGAFLGFSDLEEEGNFVTVLGQPLFTSKNSAWSPRWYRSDQPDDHKSWSKYGEDCGSLMSIGGLNDVPCQYNLPFICETTPGIERAVHEEGTSTPAELDDEDDGTLQLFPSSSMDWHDARKDCIEWGGHLAIPDSEVKMRKMTKMLNSQIKNPDKSAAFLGFYDIKEEGQFITIFGKPVFNSQDEWSPDWFSTNQPDDNKDWTSEGEDCGSMRLDGGLNDVPCRYQLLYFCEKSNQVDTLEDKQTVPYDEEGYLDTIFDNSEEIGDLKVGEEIDRTLVLFFRNDLDWFEANDACEVWGGTLAIPNSREKVEAMSLKMKSSDVEAAFLGFNDQEEEGHFVTISGTPLFDPSTWSPSWYRDDQPDDDKKWFSADGEDCGSIRSGGGLNDVPCKYRMPFFCEKFMTGEETLIMNTGPLRNPDHGSVVLKKMTLLNDTTIVQPIDGNLVESSGHNEYKR